MREAPDSGPLLDTVVFERGDLTKGWSQTPPNAAYPDGNPKTAAGAKKPDLSLIPPSALLHEALGMMNGAEKYGPFNWRDQKISVRTYIAAAMRHLQAYLDGEEYSADTVATGRPVHHLAHVRCCAGILLDAMECGTLLDNRPKVAGAAGPMIERYNAHGSFDSDPHKTDHQ